jgi:hypothetical protein
MDQDLQMQESIDQQKGFKENADQRKKMLLFWSIARGHPVKLKCFGRVEVPLCVCLLAISFRY